MRLDKPNGGLVYFLATNEIAVHFGAFVSGCPRLITTLKHAYRTLLIVRLSGYTMKKRSYPMFFTEDCEFASIMEVSSVMLMLTELTKQMEGLDITEPNMESYRAVSRSLKTLSIYQCSPLNLHICEQPQPSTGGLTSGGLATGLS